MKNFILLTVSAIIVLTLSLIALYQWDKRIAYGEGYTELRQKTSRLDKDIMALETRMNELDKAIVAHWRKQK